MKKSLQIAFAFIFLLCIVLPMAFTVYGPKLDESVEENRKLAEMPKFSWNKIEDFPQEFEAYFNDHFGLRNELIDIHFDFKTEVLNISPIPNQVIFGDDDYYFMKGRPYKCHAGLNKFTPTELQAGKSELQKRVEYMRQQGKEYYIFIAPNKHRIYTEKLPIKARQIADSIQVEQFLTLASKVEGLNVIDLAPALIAQKENADLYYKNDNHWNQFGAFVAYQEILKHISSSKYPFEPWPLDSFKIDTFWEKGGAFAKMLKKQDELLERKFKFTAIHPTQITEHKDQERYQYPKGFWHPNEYEVRISTNKTQLPRLMLFRDSFGDLVIPLLENHVSEMVTIFDAWQYKLHPEMVGQEDVDIVVLLVLERNLPCVLTGGNCIGNF